MAEIKQEAGHTAVSVLPYFLLSPKLCSECPKPPGSTAGSTNRDWQPDTSSAIMPQVEMSIPRGGIGQSPHTVSGTSN